jgi:hypothetical protein
MELRKFIYIRKFTEKFQKKMYKIFMKNLRFLMPDFKHPLRQTIWFVDELK